VILPGMVGTVKNIVIERHDPDPDVPKLTILALRVEVRAISLQGQGVATEAEWWTIPIADVTGASPAVLFTTDDPTG
jgi:hypothetical protein